MENIKHLYLFYFFFIVTALTNTNWHNFQLGLMAPKALVKIQKQYLGHVESGMSS